MLIRALKSKIHRARVTQTKIDYPGSIGVDADIMQKVGLLPYEHVLLANVTNGERVETYVVPAPPGSKDVIVLGAAARRFDVGDIIILMNFAYFTSEEMAQHKPLVVVCDEQNNTELLK